MAKSATILVSKWLWGSLSIAGWIGGLLVRFGSDLRGWAVGKMMDGQSDELMAKIDSLLAGLEWVANLAPAGFWFGVAVPASLGLLVMCGWPPARKGEVAFGVVVACGHVSGLVNAVRHDRRP